MAPVLGALDGPGMVGVAGPEIADRQAPRVLVRVPTLLLSLFWTRLMGTLAAPVVPAP